MQFTAQQIAQYVGGVIEGDASAIVNTFAKIEEGVEGALSFLSDPKYEPFVYSTASSVLLVPTDFQPAQPVAATLIRVDEPRAAIAKLLQVYEQAMRPRRTGIDALASIAPTAHLGKDVYVGPFAVIEDGATVGDGTQVYPHVVIGNGARVGKDCILYSNATIYTCGSGKEGIRKKWCQIICHFKRHPA